MRLLFLMSALLIMSCGHDLPDDKSISISDTVVSGEIWNYPLGNSAVDGYLQVSQEPINGVKSIASWN